MSRPSAASIVPWVVCAAGLWGCGAGTTRIKGNTERIIGDLVTLDLTEGDDLFSANVSLVTDADQASYDSQTLGVQRDTTGRHLTLTIPTGIRPGPAHLRVTKEGSDESYRVPLSIDRLVALMTDGGNLHLVPLPPASVTPQTIEIGGAMPLFSLSSDATTLVTATDRQLVFRRMSTDVSQTRFAPVTAPAAITVVAALSNAAVVASANAIAYWQLDNGEVTLRESRELTGAKAIAVIDKLAQPPVAAVLTDCNTGGDCISLIDFGQQPQPITPLALDDKSSATSIALSTDGLFVTVADDEAIYGVSYASDPPRVGRPLSWGTGTAAAPTQIVVTRTLVGKDSPTPQDIFAVADQVSGALLVYGAPSGEPSLLIEQPPALPAAPLEIAFGRDRDLFILTAENQLMTLTVGLRDIRQVDVALPAGSTELSAQR